MSPENTNPNPSPRLPYEAPRVVEDLPLETYSLACTGTGAKDLVCEEQGGFANT